MQNSLKIVTTFKGLKFAAKYITAIAWTSHVAISLHNTFANYFPNCFCEIICDIKELDYPLTFIVSFKKSAIQLNMHITQNL